MRSRFALAALLAFVMGTAPALAANLSGMGAAIHGSGFNFSKANLEAPPIDKIRVGRLAVDLQATRLRDVQKALGGTIQSSGDATWLCYFSEGASTWFISNALGGQEFVMMVAAETTSRMPADCEAAGDGFALPDFGVPGIGAKLADLKTKYGAASGSKIAYRGDRPGGYSDIAQYLGYQLKSGTVSGIGVGETSVPPAP